MTKQKITRRMNQNQTTLIAALFVAILFSACGDDSTTEKIVEVAAEHTAIVADVSELPKCNKDNEGGHAYVKGETSERICVDGKWFALKESEGVSDFDFSCTTKELKDKSGLKIICNGDSIGVVLNGAKGDAGEQGIQGQAGKQGEKGDTGANGEQGIQGDKGDTGVGCSVAEQTDSTVTVKCGEKSFDLKFGGKGGFDIVDTLEIDSEKIAISLDTLSGFSQKGPFLKGSTVYLYELSDGRTLKQTNGNFTSEITSNDGRYTFQSRDLVSQYALIVVDGKYQNEVTGKPTTTNIKLQAYTNMLMRKSANVNLLTHLEKNRVFYLVTKKGMTVRAAKKQAQAEIFKQFHIDTTGFKGESEDLDVFGKTDADAALLAISILLQGEDDETALSVLLTEISGDMEKDGLWNEGEAAAVKAKIADWAMVADLGGFLVKIGDNVTNWGLGEAPNFEKFIRNYWMRENGVEDCVSAIEGKVITTRDGKNRYYCFANSWISASIWSWDYPKEIYYNPQIEYDTMIDPRDKMVYNIVTIAPEGSGYSRTWFAENLNYADSSKTPSLKGRSWCYNNVAKNCDVGGRMYTWAAAIDSVKLATDAGNPQDCGYHKTCTLPAKVQGICPEGWHLPSKSEWEALLTAVGGQSNAGEILKSQMGWFTSTDEGRFAKGNGTDDFGFAALPAGLRYLDTFDGVGSNTYFWGSTEYGDNSAYGISLNRDYVNAKLSDLSKSFAIYVRCVKD